MEAIKLKAHIGADGVLTIQTPTSFKNMDTEIIIIVQPQPPASMVDAMGYPLDYFEAIDAIQADDMMERPDQGTFEIREAFE